MMRRTRAASTMAGVAVVALSLWAAATFVAPPHSRSGALRGSKAGLSGLEVAPFRVAGAPQTALDERPGAMGWAPFASLVAALGLVAGVATTTPVRAEETPAAADAQISTYETGGSYAKGGRAKAKRDTLQAKKTKSSSSSSGSASSGNSVFIGSSAAEEGKQKIIFSPADERDEDELSLSRTNRPLLALLALVPSSIFIVFWTLGSLEII
mmetsp:Transcript_111097/g.279344  ORF Transcript_111097/g.279344 Transcript_111097/m.279344 type:complete len:211 (-) Transcript_111097:248-880(-)